MPLLTRESNYVDLVISEARPSLFKRLGRQYRICTLTRSRTQQQINLKLPVAVQERIIAAYEQGKTVRIFAS